MTIFRKRTFYSRWRNLRLPLFRETASTTHLLQTYVWAFNALPIRTNLTWEWFFRAEPFHWSDAQIHFLAQFFFPPIFAAAVMHTKRPSTQNHFILMSTILRQEEILIFSSPYSISSFFGKKENDSLKMIQSEAFRIFISPIFVVTTRHNNVHFMVPRWWLRIELLIG